MKIGINGFGRIGRLVFRALWGRPGIELVHTGRPAECTNFTGDLAGLLGTRQVGQGDTAAGAGKLAADA
jgi:dihydrodipicolinate reductase